MKTKIYISGKITGIEDKAFEIFQKADEHLQSMNFETVNPMLLKHNHDKSWESYMKVCLKALIDCDKIYMLLNWRDSKGAMMELEVARKLGISVIFEKYL